MNYSLAIFLLCFVCFSCATEKMPTGGPKNATPLKVIGVEPPDSLATKFKTNKIKIKFSDWVLPAKFKSGFSIYPKIDDMDMIFNERDVEIIFNSNLKKNQTYVTSLTKTITDYNNNTLDKSYTFAFSTGDKIDSGYIKGIAFTTNMTPLKNATILAYFIADSGKTYLDKFSLIEIQKKKMGAIRLDTAKSKQDSIKKTSELKIDSAQSKLKSLLPTQKTNTKPTIPRPNVSKISPLHGNEKKASAKMDTAKPRVLLIDEITSSISKSSLDTSKAISDTLMNPYKVETQYITQSNDNGGFEFKFLQEGYYQIFGFVDKTANVQYDPAKEEFGVPQTKYIKTNVDSLTLRFAPPKDTLGCKVESAKSINRKTIAVLFSSLLKNKDIPLQEISIQDTLTQKSLQIFDVYFPINQLKDSLYIALIDTLTLQSTYKVTFQNIADKSNTPLNKASLTTTFTASYTPTADPVTFTKPFAKDTTNNALEFFNGKPNDFTPRITLAYSRPIGRDSLKKAIHLYQLKNQSYEPVALDMYFQGGTKILFKPNGNFIRNEMYKLVVDSMKVDTFKVKRYQAFFRVIPTDNLGDIEGNIFLPTDKSQTVIIVLQREKDKFQYRKSFFNIIRKQKFSFNELSEGKYSLEAFIKSDKNEEWDGGRVYPFLPATPYAVYMNDLIVRKRWTIEEIKLNFPKSK